jgi:membrane-associated protease RseP (regulator of RpoE activity)
MKKYNISLIWGFILMWRTKRGRKFLDRLSKARRFWRAYGNLAIFITTLGMLFMFFTLLLGAFIAISIRTRPVPIQNMLVLPGLNPIIPLWYGIFALAIAIIIHEFTHGILARRIKLKLKSMGVLLCVVPIGAFVEPDEKEMEKLDQMERARIFAGGPTSNIIFAIIFAGIFSWGFMASLVPAEDGVIVLNVSEDYPADLGGIEPGMVITEVSGVSNNGTIIEPVKITKREDFAEFMDKREMNDTLNITVYYNEKMYQITNITLVDEYNYSKSDEDRGKGFLGVGVNGAGEFVESLAYPISSAGWDVNQRRYNMIQYFFILPTDLSARIMPFHSPLIDAYEVSGPLSVLPTPVFWILANIFYYLFWINFLLGIFNTLPAVPLDGGYVFKDGMNTLLKKVRPKMDEKRRESLINRLSMSFAFFILMLLIMLILGPWIHAI